MQKNLGIRQDSRFSVKAFLTDHKVDVNADCPHLLKHMRNLNEFNYLTIYDFETSNLGAGIEVVEVGMMILDVKEGRSSCFSGLVDPGKPIHPSATEIHGITDADVQGKPRWKSSWGPVFSYLILTLNSVMAGWNNKAFDRHRLRSKGLFCPDDQEFDLMSCWTNFRKKKEIKLENNRLATVASYLQVATPTHRALADVLATAGVADVLCREGYNVFGNTSPQPRYCPLTGFLFDVAGKPLKENP